MKLITLISIVSGIIAGMLSMACSATVVIPEKAGASVMSNTVQQEDGRFRNKKQWEMPSFGKNVSIAWDFFFIDNQRVPDISLPVKPVDLTHFNAGSGSGLTVTWLGHSSLMIAIDGYKVLTDPVFETKVSVVGPSRFNGDLPMNPEEIDAVDVVIVSHNHYDHLNKYSIQLLTEKTGLFVVPAGVGAQLKNWGVPEDKIREMTWWKELTVGDDLMVAATPAQHFSGRGLTDRNKTLWASWVIQTPGHRVFFSGDSGYFDGFKEIGDHYGPFDMTFLECGAYDEKWYPVHMYPEETVKAHQDLRGKILHPIHWATFNLGLHPWFEPMERLASAAEKASVTAVTPIVGETTVLGTEMNVTRWWETLIADRRLN